MLQSARQMKFRFFDQSSDFRMGATCAQAEPSIPQGRDAQLLKLCRDRMAGFGLADLEDRLVVEWNGRMRSCAGRAFWPQGLIQLNPLLKTIEQEEIERTALHELAHLVAYERNPYRKIKGHGREWREACADVGIPGEKATHALALPARSIKRRWRYQCPKCLTSIDRVKRYRTPVACYDCCLKETGGVFHAAFKLREIPLI